MHAHLHTFSVFLDLGYDLISPSLVGDYHQSEMHWIRLTIVTTQPTVHCFLLWPHGDWELQLCHFLPQTKWHTMWPHLGQDSNSKLKIWVLLNGYVFHNIIKSKNSKLSHWTSSAFETNPSLSFSLHLSFPATKIQTQNVGLWVFFFNQNLGSSCWYYSISCVFQLIITP
jgi:hypothetical protein